MEIEKIGVIGAGTMGAGIAQVAARGGYMVVMDSRKEESARARAVPSGVLDSRHLAREVVRFSNHTRKMIVGCLLGGNSMKSGVRILREASMPNFSELEEGFRAVGKALGLRK